jgi:tyrosyl-tRNA synthetase
VGHNRNRISEKERSGKAYALTCPWLLLKQMGLNLVIRRRKYMVRCQTYLPYKFYQYWLNTSDADAEKYIKIFFFNERGYWSSNSRTQRSSTLTYFAKRLAEEVTTMAHSALIW